MTENTQFKTLVNDWLKNKRSMITASTHANFVLIAEQSSKRVRLMRLPRLPRPKRIFRLSAFTVT